jgi:arylsulfatase A-like enzyme
MSSARSLVLVTVDCLRADHVGFLGYKRPTTPFLDSLSAESIVLENAIAAGAPTYYSFPAIMASRYPLGMGRDVIGLSPDEPTIATTLNQIGYSTAAFIAGNPYLSKRFGYAEGFDVFEDFLEEDIKSTTYPEKSNGRTRSRVNQFVRQASYNLGLQSVYDELHFRYSQKIASRSTKSLDQLRRFPASDVIVSRAANWIRQSGHNPFFLWLHLMDPHSPYYPPHDALNLLGENEMNAVRACYLNSLWNRAGMAERRYAHVREEMLYLYDSSIRWVDQQVAGLVKSLQDLKLWDHCILALTADHGEEFLEHGGRMHTPPSVTEELVHVPLLMRIPGVGARRVNAPFSLLNLAPTLLDCVQAPSPADFRGRSYCQQLKAGQDWNDEIVVECISGCRNPFRKNDRRGPRILAVRDARYKLILDFDRKTDQLFDLQSDTRESHPLPRDVAKPVRRRLLERARKHIAQSPHSRDTNSQLVLALRNLMLEPGLEAQYL